MKNMLTFVVHIFKAEQYINKCLESFVLPEEQMTQFEMFVINDDIPDDSIIMAKEIEKKSSNIQSH